VLAYVMQESLAIVGGLFGRLAYPQHNQMRGYL